MNEENEYLPTIFGPDTARELIALGMIEDDDCDGAGPDYSIEINGTRISVGTDYNHDNRHDEQVYYSGTYVNHYCDLEDPTDRPPVTVGDFVKRFREQGILDLDVLDFLGKLGLVITTLPTGVEMGCEDDYDEDDEEE